MRVLFTVYPSHAHLWPAVPVAWALQSAGHEVRVATHAAFTAEVVATGLTPIGLGDANVIEPRMRPDAQMPAQPDLVLRYAEALGLSAEEREHWIIYQQWLLNPISDFIRTDLPYANGLVEFAKTWQPDLMIWDPTFSPAPFAARAAGAAHARLLIGPDYPGWGQDQLRRGAAALRAAGLPENPHAELLKPFADQLGYDLDDEFFYGQFSLDPMPKGMTLPTSTIAVPMRYVPYTGAATHPEWLYAKPERPRVALSLGESTRRFIKGDWGRTPKILEAVADLDIELVGTLNAQQLEGVEHVPDNVKLIDWVTLTHLLPTCAAMIHHGGIGTFEAAAALKVPQIICDTGETVMMRAVEVDPRTMAEGTYRIGYEFGVREEVEMVTTWELPAKKIEATPTSNYVLGRGAGERLDHVGQTVDEIRKLIFDVVTEQRYQDGAQAVLDDWLAAPSPADVVPTLERLTAEHRRR
jgi:glycosyltransferase